MAEKRFNSKVDTWIGLLLGFVVIVDVAFVIMLAQGTDSPGAKTGAILTMIAALLLLLWLAFSTYYTVDKQTLRVVSGPFRWKIPLADIQAVTPSRALWSSPALSLDRLRVEYGKNRRVLVSPADKAGFLRALGQDVE